MPLELTLTNEEKILLTVHPVTAAGKPAALDGPVSFTVASGSCTLMPVDDASVEVLTSDTELTDTVIICSADADLGAGVETISDSVLVHTLHANASALGLSAGTPELK